MSCMLLVLLLICKGLITKTENLYNQPLKNSFLCKDIPSTTMGASVHFFTKYWFYSTNIPLGGLNLWGNWFMTTISKKRSGLVVLLETLTNERRDFLWNKKGKKKKGIVSTSQARIFNSI